MKWKGEIGKTYGRLKVLRFAYRKYQKVFLLCECGCGKRTNVEISNLRYGRTKSCRCLRPETSREIHLTHGESHRTLEYTTWTKMKSRCYNPNVRQWPWYGARGISVCDRWRNSYENFLADMGRRPAPKYSIERIDNDGNYEPENCRWATALEQAQNRRVAGAY